MRVSWDNVVEVLAHSDRKASGERSQVGTAISNCNSGLYMTMTVTIDNKGDRANLHAAD